MILFDSHAHYDDERFDIDRDQVLSALPDAGVQYVVNPAGDMDGGRRILALAERFAFVYAACGIHPHCAAQMTDADLDTLRSSLSHPKAVALGEIGLDYHYDFAPREVQKRRFFEQLELAKELDVPVIVHEREASADCLALLKSVPGVRGVCHCFSGSVETARELLKLGFFLSFTGVITFKNARRASDVIRMIPEDMMMIETDAPYLTPEPFRGKRNDSRFLCLILNAVAEIRGLAPEAAASLTTDNALRFYGIKY